MTSAATPTDQRVFTIPSGVAFVDALANGLLGALVGDPLALSRTTVLLPTRRAVRALSEAFLRRTEGRPLLLPQLRPIGDVETDALELEMAASPGLPPEMPPLRRQLMLARLIMARADTEMTVEHAARLADELARLIDRVDTEGLDFSRLSQLVPSDYARHWQDTLRFLTIVTQHWPAVLAESGALDPARRRRLALEAQAEAWRARPPAGPVVIAGSTGSIPATAALMATVMGLPHGMIVLPGLDRDADDATWDALEPSHPQFGLKQLLERLRIARADVTDWPGIAGLPRTEPARAALVNAALMPATTSDAWRNLPPPTDSALDGVSLLVSANPQEEASAIAIYMRGALEEAGRTAALVTPDRDLARRVAAELARWGIDADDSAGRPLGDTPPGAFLALVLDMVAHEMAPVPLLAALKHPLAAGGRDTAETRALVRRLEIAVLRGPRPAPGPAALRRALGRAARVADRDAIDSFLAALDRASMPLARALVERNTSLAALARAHAELAEWLAATASEAGPIRLWAGAAGEAAATFMAELADAASDFPGLNGADYPAFFKSVLAARRVRLPYGGHPRLAIWGPLEARLQHADLVILGGLNEGTWPPEPENDPWMSRPMRARFGLAQPERRIGLAAHDFAQALGAPQVVLSRARRVEGTPTVPSRWLLRLEALLARFPGKSKTMALRAARTMAGLEALDRPDHWPAVKPIPSPAPRPPVEVRPRTLSVTRIGTWMRDPYAIYARYILDLEPLEPLDAEAGAAERGRIIHQALDDFIKACPGQLPPDAHDRLVKLGRRAFQPWIDHPGVKAFWWPRFLRVAEWFVANERQRRQEIVQCISEAIGKLELPGPAGRFVLTAKADRLERDKTGGTAVIDYKTGTLPPIKSVKAGLDPQLPLEALIARAGGFSGIAASHISSLEHWRLSGGSPAGEIKPVADESKSKVLIDEAEAGLCELIARFDDAATAYLAVPDPDRAPTHMDYAHLARIKEWAREEGGET
ncbi:MAG: double-strand break repair protein AddB [Alphaproteobacteria bacterium]|nr:double-strand break repair protein AddB [Alphaproteobacteria bacterium]